MTETMDPTPDSGEAVRDRSGLPGAQLRSAREQRQLSREEVAERLRLPPQLVAALEEDDYEKFPAPIYVSGYLRNYARLLSMPAQPLVEAYERLGVEQPPVLHEMTRRMAQRRPLKPQRRVVLWVAAGLAILLLVWLLTRGGGPVVGPGGTPGADAALPEAPAEPAVQTAAEEPAAPGRADHPGGEAQSMGSEAAQATGPGAPDGAEAAQGAGADGGSDVLVLHFSEDSWAEVADATQRRLLYRIARAGDTFELRGVAPFDVLLGNSPAVSVEFNGRPYNPVRGNRYNVASFKIGGGTN